MKKGLSHDKQHETWRCASENGNRIFSRAYFKNIGNRVWIYRYRINGTSITDNTFFVYGFYISDNTGYVYSCGIPDDK